MNTLQISIDTKSGIPLYVQIRDQIKEAIESGQIPPHYRLHTIRDLAKILKINANTVARAYRELEYQGYLQTLSGRGSFVLYKSTGPVDFEPDFWIVSELEDCLKRIQNEWHVPSERLQQLASQAIERLSSKNQGEKNRRR